MTINKQSWHYRLWVKSFANKRDVPATVNLCPYFWTVVLVTGNKMVTAIGISLLVAVILGVLCTAMWMVGLALFQGIPAAIHVAQGQPEPESVTEGMGFGLLLVGLALTLIVVYARYIHRHIVSTLSLGFGFAKAKLGGFCPTVSFKD